MALNDYPIFFNVANGDLIRDFDSNVGATLPAIKQGDTLRLLLHGLLQNPNVASNPARPWVYATLPSTLRAGIGVVGASPELGTFTLTFGANTTSALAYDATAAQIEAALDLLASVISAGGCAVSGAAGGPWRVVFGNVGARDLITGNSDLLYPSTSVSVVESRAGTASIPEIQTITLERQTAAYTDSFTDFPAASVTVTTLQVGASGTPEVQRITLSPNPIGGTFTLTFSGQTTSAIPYNATADEVKTALGALSNIVGDDPDTDDDESEVLVSGGFPVWDVSFRGTLTGNQPEMTGNGAGLLVPLGKIGELDLNTDGIGALVAAGTDTVTFEIESSTEPFTPLQVSVELLNDLIPNTPTGPTPLAEYMLKSVYDSESAGYISGRTGENAGSGTGGDGGLLILDGGDADTTTGTNGGAGGTVTMVGGDAGPGFAGGAAGFINTSGGDAGVADGPAGGNIDTSGGASGAGGEINTSNGGGDIITTGTGTIELGNLGTRTTLNGNASADRTITLPDAAGTLALAGTVTGSGITMATARLLGRTTVSAGAVEEITIGAGLTLAGGELSASATGATLGANTFTRIQTIAQGTANEGILSSTGYSLTGSDATSMVNLAGTLNTTGVVDVLKLNVTNTASGAGSNLLNLQVGGTSKFAFGVDGTQTFNYTGDVFFLKAGSSGFGQLQVLWRTNDTYGTFRDANGNTFFRFGTGRCSVDGTLGFGSLNNADSPDAFLVRDAANIVAFKNGTNAQTCRVYGNATGSHYLNATHNGTNAILSVNGGGDLHISSLPTANPGPGILWNNAGTPAIGT